VLILHHTGKSETSKLYRGSSDIKAAVDIAYVLTRDTQQPEQLGQLSMECFKARLAPGRNFSMEFKNRQGFISCEATKHAKTTMEIIADILTENPNSNQSEIVRLGRSRGCSRGQLEQCLKTGNWQRVPGPNNSTLYSLPPEDTAQGEQE
jgi:predicted peptidase